MDKKIGIVILGASEIAYRRFLPALQKDNRFVYIGVAYQRDQDKGKAILFKKDFGGTIFTSFIDAINDTRVDAVYVPQPPALHYEFGKTVLESGKHLFMEKPFTIDLATTKELVSIAKEKQLGIHENYMFIFHKQISEVVKLVSGGVVGKLSHYEMKFCFPLRNLEDFRYKKKLGGGALLDCGGYPIFLSRFLVGKDAKLIDIKIDYDIGFEVDMHGKGRMISNKKDFYCDFYYGMNDEYSCYIEAHGTSGILKANRVFTAPADFDILLELYDNDIVLINSFHIGKDDSFLHSLNAFYESIINNKCRETNIEQILEQAKYIDIMQKELVRKETNQHGS